MRNLPSYETFAKHNLELPAWLPTELNAFLMSAVARWGEDQTRGPACQRLGPRLAQPQGPQVAQEALQLAQRRDVISVAAFVLGLCVLSGVAARFRSIAKRIVNS